MSSQEYRLIYHKAALKYLEKQEKAVQERIIKNINGLLTNPMSGDIKRMKGDTGILRLKIWAYRVIFRLDRRYFLPADHAQFSLYGPSDWRSVGTTYPPRSAGQSPDR